jgi:hypothetical protein
VVPCESPFTSLFEISRRTGEVSNLRLFFDN